MAIAVSIVNVEVQSFSYLRICMVLHFLLIISIPNIYFMNSSHDFCGLTTNFYA